LIGPEIHDRWQVLAAGGPEAAERIHAFVVWTRQQLIAAGLSLGSAVVQLILAILTAFFLYRDGAAA
jgi:predicted PurR-regulated permease PerM